MDLATLASGRRTYTPRLRASALVVVALAAASCSGSDRGSREEPNVAPSPKTEASIPAEETETSTLTDRLEAELTINDQPDWMVAEAGSIWVTRDEAAAVDRIDPETNEVVATVEVGDHPCNGIVAEAGSVWVPSCTNQSIYRIDPKTEKVAATIKVPIFRSFAGEVPSEIAAGAGAVWTVTEGRNGDFDALARIDAKTSRVTDKIELGHVGAGVAASDDAVWVASPNDDMLVRVDPKTLKVVAEVKDVSAPNFVATDGTDVWALGGQRTDQSLSDGSVTRIDAGTNEIVATIPIDENPGAAGDIEIGEDGVWVRTQYTLLAKIDPATNEVTDRIEDQKGLGGVVNEFGSVWLSDFAFNKVWRVRI